MDSSRDGNLITVRSGLELFPGHSNAGHSLQPLHRKYNPPLEHFLNNPEELHFAFA